MRDHNKRWLISRMKTSGSKRKYVTNARYADERNSKKDLEFEMLPTLEPIKATYKFYNGKINYGLLARFLLGQVGKDWDLVHAEILSRIPTRLLNYQEMIYWFVADNVVEIEGRLWNKRSQRFIRTGAASELSLENKMFYVDPETNILVQVANS